MYLDGLAVACPGDARDGEAVVAFLHDEVVRPEILLDMLGHPPAEDGHDADVERELKKKGRKVSQPLLRHKNTYTHEQHNRTMEEE